MRNPFPQSADDRLLTPRRPPAGWLAIVVVATLVSVPSGRAERSAMPSSSDNQQASQQTTQQEQQQEEEIEIPAYAETVVVTASRVEETLLNAPAAISVIGSDIIDSSPAQNYGDLLRTVPGINVTQTSARDINVVGRGAASTLATSQLALLDGRSIYQDFFGFVAWDFLPIDTSEIAQIEVIRGPASAVWGANAMTGVVNVITKTPREVDATTVSLGYGAFDRDVNGNGLDSGNIWSVNLTHAQAVNDMWAYKFSTGFYKQDALPRPTGVIPNESMTPYPPFVNSGTQQPKIDFRVDYDHPDGQQAWTFGGGFAGTEGIIHTGIGPFQIDRGTALGYAKAKYTRDSLSIGFFTNLLSGEAPALLAVGADGQPINFLFDNKTFDFELNDSRVLGTQHFLSYGGNVRYNSFDLSIAPRGDSRNEVGLYLQDEIFLSDTFRWIVGARVDRFSVLDRFVFSPRTTFMIKPNADHAFRISFNRAFRAPSFVNSFLDVTIINQIDLGAIIPALAGVPYVFPSVAIGNESLNEETLTAYELGYVGTLAKRATVSVAYYFNNTRDSINFATDASRNYSSANPPPRWPLPPQVLDLLALSGNALPGGFGYFNLAKVRDQGIELSIDTHVTDALTAFANYSWQDVPNPAEGVPFEELNLPPTHRVNLGMNFDRDRIFGNFSVSYTDEAFWQDVLDGRFNGTTEAYTLVNAGFGVRWSEDRVTTAIKINNIGNTDALQHIFGDIIKRQVVVELKFKLR